MQLFESNLFLIRESLSDTLSDLITSHSILRKSRISEIDKKQSYQKKVLD